jgi:hypothetical protein
MRGKEMFKRVAPDELDTGDIIILPPDKKTNKLRLSSRALSSQVKLEHGGGLCVLGKYITEAPPNEMFVVNKIARQALSHKDLISYYATNTTQLNITNKKQISQVFFRPLTSMSVTCKHIHWINDIREEILRKVDPIMLDWRKRWDAGELLIDRNFDTIQVPDLAISVLRETTLAFSDDIPMVCSNAVSRMHGDPREVLDALQSGTLLSNNEFLDENTETIFNSLVCNWGGSFPRYRSDIIATDFSAFKKWLERGAIIIRPVSKEALTFLLYEMFRRLDQGLDSSSYATKITDQANREEAALKKLKEACAYDLRRLKQRKKYWLNFPQQLKKRGQKATEAFEKLLKEKSHD